MKYVAAFILTVILSPLLVIWYLLDIVSGNDFTSEILDVWWNE